MLVNDDKYGRKKQKDYQKTMNKKRNRSHNGRQLLYIVAGSVLSVAAVLLLVIGIISFTSRGATDSLKLVTNTGKELQTNETVMDGAEVSVEGYQNNGSLKIYYQLTDTPYGDTSGLDLSTNGTQYTKNSIITLTRSSAEGDTRYLYIQQRRSDGNSQTDCYKITFHDFLTGASSNPTTSDSNMTSVSVGQKITFSGAGNMYYTDDGSEPYFVRDKSGEIEINGERFRKGNPTMKELELGNKITVEESWLTESTKTIRVISYANGYDFSPITTFRFKILLDKAQSPTISPETTAENPITVDSGTKVILSTETQGGTILYTTDGSIPMYSVSENGTSYRINPKNNTNLFEEPFPVEGAAGDEIVITAKTVKISTDTGVSVMKDSDPVQFKYKITALGTASTPEVSPESGAEISLNSKIYLNTSTSGGTILYTTDGSTPDYTIKELEDGSGYELELKGSTKIYGEKASYVEVAEPDAAPGQTFLVLAKTIVVDLNTGQKLMEDSSVGQFSYRISDAAKVAEVTATPKTSDTDPTIIKEGSKIILSCTTAGANIYYTMDGTAPVIKTDGTLMGTTKLYNGTDGIPVPAGAGYLTITAVAKKAGMNDSATVQFQYKYPDIVAPPYATPAEGTVSINTEVKLASLDAYAQIYYTLDGSEPTITTGRFYSEPILLTQDTVIKAMCVLDGISSSVRTFTYQVAEELQAPAPSIKSGAVVASGTTIELTAQKGAQVFYTLDGSSPREDKAMAGSMVTITGKPGETITLLTCARGSNYSDSQTATYVYTISNYENGIKVNPEAGSRVKEGDVITLETDVTNGTIYYATGGDNPDTAGIAGTQVTVGKSDPGKEETKFTLKATVACEGSTFKGTITSFIYEFMEKPVAPKASIPNGAVLLENKDITLTADKGDIYYTMDGTEPDSKSDIYTDPIPITEEATIKAIAISDEGAESEVATFAYTFAEQAQPPVFSIKGGEVESGTTLTITSATADAVIYYTTDGQIPTLNNPKNLYIYSGAIVLNKPVNIKAMAVKERMANSEVTGAIFTVKEPEIIEEKEESEEEEDQKNGNRLMSRRAYMNEKSGPAYSDFVRKSAATGVVISAEEGTVVAEAEIEVTETPVDDALNSAVENSVGKEYGAVSSYEISLSEGTEAVQPAGDVEIGLPVLPEYQNKAISIAYVNEDGNVEAYETRRDNDMAYAHVTHFGRYCIVAPIHFEEEEPENNIMKLAVAVIGMMGTGYGLLRLGRKRRKESRSILDD